jgi:hypothetical protein
MLNYFSNPPLGGVCKIILNVILRSKATTLAPHASAGENLRFKFNLWQPIEILPGTDPPGQVSLLSFAQNDKSLIYTYILT